MASGVVTQSVYDDELEIPSCPPQLVRQKAVWLVGEKVEEINLDDPMRKTEKCFIEPTNCLVDIRNYMALPELIRPSMEMIYEELVMTGMLKV